MLFNNLLTWFITFKYYIYHVWGSLFILALASCMLGLRLNASIGTYEMRFGSGFHFTRNHSSFFIPWSLPALSTFRTVSSIMLSLPSKSGIAVWTIGLVSTFIFSLNATLLLPHFWIPNDGTQVHSTSLLKNLRLKWDLYERQLHPQGLALSSWPKPQLLSMCYNAW